MRPVIIGDQIEREFFASHPDALDFLRLWQEYVHVIDDIVDGDERTKEGVIAAFAKACVLFSHPFYLKHLAALREVVLLVTNAFADSVAWENASEEWKRSYVEVIRHAGADMVRAVVSLTGGYERVREISPLLYMQGYYDHHDKDNKPV